ncbi:MAG TPA: outer membrane beta-barrel protein, partial [bacterium]|nr:outer membrane beta-barrel protein [bacterium]
NWTPSSTFNVTGYATDGNNTVNSSSDGKTYGLEAVLAPSSQWSFTVNGLLGPTAGNATIPNDLTNFVGEAIIKFMPDSMWSFGLDAQYAMTSLPSGTTPSSASYWGLALYGRDQIASDWAVALRLEDLTDSGEIALGSGIPDGSFYNGSAWVSTSFYEGTLTLEHDYTANLLGRLEGRFDTNATPTGVGTATAAAPIYNSQAGSTSEFSLTYSTVLTF